MAEIYCAVLVTILYSRTFGFEKIERYEIKINNVSIKINNVGIDFNNVRF